MVQLEEFHPNPGRTMLAVGHGWKNVELRLTTGARGIGNPAESKILSRGVLPRRPDGASKGCHHQTNLQPPAAMKTLSQIPAKLLMELVLYAHVAIGIQILSHLLQ